MAFEATKVIIIFVDFATDILDLSVEVLNFLLSIDPLVFGLLSLSVTVVRRLIILVNKLKKLLTILLEGGG